MKFKILAILFLATFLLTGCSKKLAPDAAYALLKKREVITAEQFANLTPVDIVIPGKEEMYKLSVTDSVAAFGKDQDMLSNFRLFYLDTKPNTTYRVIVKSYCNCFGFTKHIFQPIIHIYNGSQPLKPELNNAKYTYDTERLALNELFTFNSQNNNTRLLVFSNNNDLNKIAYTFDIFFIKSRKDNYGRRFQYFIRGGKIVMSVNNLGNKQFY